jgi:TatD DNase family protein
MHPEFIDTHVHVDLMRPEDGVSAVLARAAAAGVTRLLAVGNDPPGNAAALGAALEHPAAVRAALGYGRDCATKGVSVAELERLIRGAPAGMIVAVGEIGLDFHYLPETAVAQRQLMREQLDLARQLELPAIVHSREAEAATLDLLAAHVRAWTGAPDRVGVLHCFTGDLGFAERVLALGFFVSFSGILTFRNAAALREVAKTVPAERLLIETDSPYLAPVPHRGSANEPAFLPAVARSLAEARRCRVEDVATLTTRNAERLFGWPARAVEPLDRRGGEA